jgi:hypothetical protein
MLAVPGILVPEALGYGNWVKAQEWAALPGGDDGDGDGYGDFSSFRWIIHGLKRGKIKEQRF